MFAMNSEKSGLDKTIDALIKSMSNEPADSEAYSRMADQLVKLYNLKEVDSKGRVSPDTLAVAAANLLGILWITSYEREHILISKVHDFILKLR